MRCDKVINAQSLVCCSIYYAMHERKLRFRPFFLLYTKGNCDTAFVRESLYLSRSLSLFLSKHSFALTLSLSRYLARSLSASIHT